MAGNSSVMFGWSWIEVSVLGSQVFGQASMERCLLEVAGLAANVLKWLDMAGNG